MPITAAPTETSTMQTGKVGHLVDEPDNNNQDTSLDKEDKTVTVSSAKKRRHGPTTGKSLIRIIGSSDGKKLKIEVDPTVGRPITQNESAKLSSEVGVVTRDILPIPRKWKEVDVESDLQPCLDHMQIHMDINLDKPGVVQCLIDRLKNSSRQQRHKLHLHFLKYENAQEVMKNKPKTITYQQRWEVMCDYFDSDRFKNQSRVNKGNRKQMKSKHVTGRTPFTIIQHEISRKNGKAYGRIELYRKTHQNVKGKWSSEVAKDSWALMKEPQKKYADDGIPITEDEIVEQVLGKENGYVKGLGYGPKPRGKRNTILQQQLDKTEAELKVAQSDNAAYKCKVDAMEAKLAILMAYMEPGQRKGGDEVGDEIGNEDGDEYGDEDDN